MPEHRDEAVRGPPAPECPERIGHRQGNKVRLGDGREIDQAHTVRVSFGLICCQRQRETRLADTRRSGQGYQARTITKQLSAKRQVGLAPDERRRQQRDIWMVPTDRPIAPDHWLTLAA